MKRMYLDGTHIVIDTPYNQDEVRALKNGIKSARWDRLAKVWKIPLSDTQTALNFANAWEIDVDDDLRYLQLPDNKFEKSKIVQSGDKLIITIAYDPVKIDQLRHITGIGWDAKSKDWLAPFSSVREVIDWADKFDVPVPEHIKEQVKIEEMHEDFSIQLSRAHDASITVDGLNMELYPYQRAGVLYASEKRKCFIADEMGLGKSLQAIATVQYTDSYPALIVCPSSLLIDWKTKIHDALPDRTVQVIPGKGTTPDLSADFVIISYNNLNHHKANLAKYNLKGLVLDESHFCKNTDAQRTKAAKFLAKKIDSDGVVLLLTGTPITNKPAEFAPQLQIIDQIDQFGGLWGFYKRYCDAYKDRWGHWHKDGATNLKELHNSLRKSCYVRREKEEVLTDLPPITYNTISTELPKKFQAEYNRAKNDLIDWYTEEKERLARQEGKNPTAARIKAHFATMNFEELIQMTALRKIVARAKIDAAIEWVNNANEQGEKVVIAAHHREIVQSLAQATGGLMIIGGQNPEVTEADKRKFMNEPDHMNITVSITAAGHGHTLTASSNMLIVEPPWTPAQYRQTAARIHRIGQTGAVTIHNMVVPNTIDTHVYSRLQEKMANTDPAISDTPNIVELIDILL